MGKRLIITEKPSVARDIVAALGGFKDREGFWESDDQVVTFAVGHLLELLEPEDLDPKYKRWTLDTLPIIPGKFEMKPKAGQNDRLKVIKKLAERDEVDRIVNACDAGREGELIFREIVDYWGIDKPIERLWLQSMTKDAIRRGFADLAPGDRYQGLRDAAYCRTHADWLIGMNATRALTRRLKTRSESQAWSAGRVQTPTLAMLVMREFEILAHKAEPFWRIVGTFDASGSSYKGTWLDPAHTTGRDEEDEKTKPDRVFDEARAKAIVAKVQGALGATSETRKPSREAAPPLFDLTSLQREANRRFGWSARRTLNAAQRCYEVHKVLTYPRTDTRALPSDYRPVVGEIISSLESDPRYRDAAKFLVVNGRQNEGRIFDDAKVTDHFAIVPTGLVPERALDGDDGKLFDLVTRRFLAAFHPAAVWSRVERMTIVEGEHFRSRARILQEPGWRTVFGETETLEGDGALPPLVPGKDEVDGVPSQNTSIEMEKEETKPPPRITEGRLLSLMENAGQQVEDEEAAEAMKDKGIGTPATRADIIENLISKGYVERVGKALRPTVKGIRLVDILRRMHADRLASPQLTGDMEQHLLQVEHREREPRVFMDEIVEYATDIVDRTKRFEFEELFPNDESLGKCPLCARDVYERSWFYRCEEPEGLEAARKAKKSAKKKNVGTALAGEHGGNGEAIPEVVDCPFRIWKDKSGRYIDRLTVRELLENKITRVLDGFATRQGRSYRAQLSLDDTGEIHIKGVADETGGSKSGEDLGLPAIPEYEVDDTPLGPCPHCKSGEIVETRATFVCSKGLALLRQIGKDDATIYPLKKKEIPEGAEYCTFLLSRTVCHREIARQDAKTYLESGRTPLITDFISRKGRPFSAILFLKEDGRYGFEFPPRGGGEAGAAQKKKAPAQKKMPAAKKKAAPKKRAPAKKKKAIAKNKAAPKKAAKAKKAAPGKNQNAEPPAHEEPSAEPASP